MCGAPRHRPLRGETHIGVARVLEVSRTGTTINDVPQYDIFLRVTPADGNGFIAQLRTVLEASDLVHLGVGEPLPVRYSTTDHDTVEIADATEPAVRDAVIDWRIQRGLIDPRLVRGRRGGI